VIQINAIDFKKLTPTELMHKCCVLNTQNKKMKDIIFKERYKNKNMIMRLKKLKKEIDYAINFPYSVSDGNRKT